METTETKNAIQTAANETAASARKVGGKLRTLAGSAADSSKRWARRCGDMLSQEGGSPRSKRSSACCRRSWTGPIGT